MPICKSLKSSIMDVLDRQGPESFLCPLSMETMREPVFTRDGHCYERDTIENWLRSNDTSPLTGNKLEDKSLVPAIALRKCIEEWRESIVKTISFSSLKIAEEIGRGKTKVAYRAVLDGENVAAIDILDKSKCTVFAIKILAWIKIPPHPRLVRVIGVSFDTARELLVAEHAPLGTVPEALRYIGKVPMPHKNVILQQVCGGMEALVAMGLLHQDLALRNVLAFHYDADDAAATSVKLHNLSVSAFEDVWAAPEVLRGLAATEQSDVWSFGVLAWELLADGRRPYAGAAGGGVASRVLEGERPSRVHTCPDGLWDTVTSCWAESPQDRPTFRRLSNALGAIDTEGVVPSVRPRPLATPSSLASDPEAVPEASRFSSGSVGLEHGVGPGASSTASAATLGWRFLMSWMAVVTTGLKVCTQTALPKVKASSFAPPSQGQALVVPVNLGEQREGSKLARRRIGVQGRRAEADSEPARVARRQRGPSRIAGRWGVGNWSTCLSTSLGKTIASRLQWLHCIGLGLALIMVIWLFMPENEIKNLITVLNRPREKEDALVPACMMLSAASEHLKINERKQGIEALIGLLKWPDTSEAVLAAASEALAVLASESEGRKVAGQAGGTHAVISLLKRPFMPIEVLEAVCGAFGTITDDVENAILAGQQGGIQAVIGLLKRSGGSLKGVQLVALGPLRNMMRDYENMEAARLAGGIKVVVDILKDRGVSQAVLEATCRVLGAMSVDIEFANAVVQEGGIKAVFGLLNQPGVSEGVLEAAFGTIGYMIQDFENMKIVREAGGVEAVIHLLKMPGVTDAILEASCGALGTMVLDVENAYVAAQEGGFEGLIRLLKNPGLPEPVLEAACGALGNLVEEMDQKRGAGLAGGVQVVIGLLKRPGLSDAVLEAACGALGTMVLEMGNAKLARLEGGMEAVIGLLKRSGGTEGIHLVALGTMRNMMQDVQNVHAARQAGGIEAVIDVLRKADASEAVLDAACEALVKMSRDLQKPKGARQKGWPGMLKGVLDAVCTELT